MREGSRTQENNEEEIKFSILNIDDFSFYASFYSFVGCYFMGE